MISLNRSGADMPENFSPTLDMRYHNTATLLAAEQRTGSEPETPNKVTIHVTESFKAIVDAIAKHSSGRVSHAETVYFRDVARGHYRTADFVRIALGARRSPFHTDQRALLEYVRNLVQSDSRNVLPLDRARLRKTKECAEVMLAEAKHDFRSSAESLDELIAEAKEAHHALGEWILSLEAERAAKYGETVSA
jgi:hypothetical protein